MRWQISVPALELILVLGAVGTWLYNDHWISAPEGALANPVLGLPNGPAFAVHLFRVLDEKTVSAVTGKSHFI